VRGAVLGLVVGLALALAPASALASSRDVATTTALAQATNTLVRAAGPEIPRGLAAVRSYASQLIAQCPGAATGSPQNHEAEQLDDELIGSMTSVGYHVAAGSIAAWSHAVSGLHWSNARLTRAVHRFAKRLVGLSTLTVPDVCGDLRAWGATGFQTVPASTVAFDQHYYAVDPEAEEVPLIIRLATPYATPSEIPVLKRVERLEVKLGEAEAAAVETYSRVIISLELKQ
jgi:hypothetical protein